MDYSEFVTRLTKIKELGYIASHRTGDTGIGKTLEDLLEISENNIAGPDFEIYELIPVNEDGWILTKIIDYDESELVLSKLRDLEFDVNFME